MGKSSSVGFSYTPKAPPVNTVEGSTATESLGEPSVRRWWWWGTTAVNGTEVVAAVLAAEAETEAEAAAVDNPGAHLFNVSTVSSKE